VGRATTTLVGRVLRTLHLTRLGWRWLAGPVTMGVRVVVPDAEGRVLLVRHSYVGGWHLPGGGVGRAESLKAAALRELSEECGVHAAEARLLGIYLRVRLGGRHTDHVAVFVAEAWSGTPRGDGREILETRFFPADALPEDATTATRRRIAEWRGSPVDETW